MLILNPNYTKELHKEVLIYVIFIELICKVNADWTNWLNINGRLDIGVWSDKVFKGIREFPRDIRSSER